MMNNELEVDSIIDYLGVIKKYFKSIKKMLEIRILRVFMTVLHIFPIKQNKT